MQTVDASSPLPLYYQVYRSLLGRIRGDEYTPGDALPPERRLTELYGVSRITVVKALDLLERDGVIERQHGRGTFVREPERETAPPPTLSFLPGGLVHPYHYSVQVGIARVAAERRANLNVLAHYRGVSSSVDELSSRVAGFIVYPKGQESASLYQDLLERQHPLVMVDRYLDGVEADAVVFDDEVAAYKLTRHLLRRGHERLAFVNHREPDVSASKDRLAGFARALRDAGLGVDSRDDAQVWLEPYADYAPFEGGRSHAHLTEALAAKLTETGVDALVAVNHDVSERLQHDLMLLSAERTHPTGRGLGRNVEVAGFGHKHPADYGPFHVATALQLGEALGQRAAEMLLERLDGGYGGPPRLERLPVTILYRKEAET